MSSAESTFSSPQHARKRSRQASASPAASTTPDTAQARIAQLRDEACAEARPLVSAGAAPIRVMAKMVADLEVRCRALSLPAEVVAREIVNRTIGDIDTRRISATLDGPEYVTLADDMGLALPGEVIDGYTATGQTYRALRDQMEEFERELLARHIDLRMYDISGAGNMLLREMVAAYVTRQWGVTLPPAQLYLSLGSLDGLGKFFQGYAAHLRTQGQGVGAIVFPAPGFNVPEWQARNLGFRLHRLTTRAEDAFKMTSEGLQAAFAEADDIRAVYLTISNNPTAFSYSPAELRALYDVARQHQALLIADLAYIGTGVPAEDAERMAVFAEPEVMRQTVLCASFSKSHTLTGDRFGWVGLADPELAKVVGSGWTNTTAALPAEWQLRYMGCVRLFGERPDIEQRLRALYRLRRERLARQLRALDEQHHLFARVNLDDGATVYNWSQLRPGEDVFSLFSKTGIAGVPGSAFGYTDDFIRLSVGCIPVPEV